MTTKFPVTITTLEELRLLKQEGRTEAPLQPRPAAIDEHDHIRTRLIVIHRTEKDDPHSPPF